MGQYFNTMLRPYGVAQSQWYMLYAISQAPQITQKELQTALRVESATLTAAVNALVRKGWVERVPNTPDRRVKVLRFTPSGRALWERLPDPITAIRKQMLQGINAKDEEVARKVLDKVIQNLEQ